MPILDTTCFQCSLGSRFQEKYTQFSEHCIYIIHYGIISLEMETKRVYNFNDKCLS